MYSVNAGNTRTAPRANSTAPRTVRYRLPLLTLIAAASPLALASNAAPTPARQQELTHLLYQDCGSCHGLSLKGGLGPPLLPETLTGKPVEFLAATILHGRPGTPMPPWGSFLTPEEAAWIANRIKGEVQ